jgi:hypothetical protein
MRKQRGRDVCNYALFCVEALGVFAVEAPAQARGVGVGQVDVARVQRLLELHGR